MSIHSKLIATGALAAVAAVAPVAGASAHIDVGVDTVRTHTDRADSALDRAVSLFERNAHRRGSHELARSRRELGRATAEAARLRRQARTQNQRAEAARATTLVAVQRDENIEPLVGALDDVSGRVENAVAKAALADTRGRDKAMAVISSLLEQGLSEKAALGLSKALAALAQDRDDEVQAEAVALVGRGVSRSGKRTLARTVGANVAGQSTAAEKLAALIADPDVPAEAKPGLQRAYEAVIPEHAGVAAILARFSDRMPAFVRSFVEQVITQARMDAQGMHEYRPTPPAGGQQTWPTAPSQGGPGWSFGS